MGLMEISTVQTIKMAVSSTVGLSYDGLHVYVSLMVFFMAARILNKPLHSPMPWLAVLLIAIAGEVLDRRDDFNQLHHWRWEASLHDIVNTLFWPSIILLMARYGQYFN